jgi:hypothetical protein
MSGPYLFAVGYVLVLVVATWLLFQHGSFRRPWIGVFNGSDVVAMFCVIVALPYIAVAAPTWSAAATLILVGVLTTYFVARIAVESRAGAATVSMFVLTAEIATTVVVEPASDALLVMNGGVFLVLIVGLTCLIAQSGMRTAHVAFLALVLALYEIVVRPELVTLLDLVETAGELPFVPVVSWQQEGDHLAMGLDVLIVAALLPLVSHKAFGRPVGIIAAFLSMAAVAGTLALVDGDVVDGWAPIVALALLSVLQYGWSVSRGGERTTGEYLLGETCDPGFASPPAYVGGASMDRSAKAEGGR